MVYAVFSHRKSPQARFGIFLTILALAAFITGYYHYLQDPVFHQNMFALLTVVVVLRSMWIMELLLRPSRRAQRGETRVADPVEQTRIERRDEEILKTMWMMIACGISAVACGFLIWNLDNIFCGVLRRWRRDVGLPWGILLEGHGWWWAFFSVSVILPVMVFWMLVVRDIRIEITVLALVCWNLLTDDDIMRLLMAEIFHLGGSWIPKHNCSTFWIIHWQLPGTSWPESPPISTSHGQYGYDTAATESKTMLSFCGHLSSRPFPLW